MQNSCKEIREKLEVPRDFFAVKTYQMSEPTPNDKMLSNKTDIIYTKCIDSNNRKKSTDSTWIIEFFFLSPEILLCLRWITRTNEKGGKKKLNKSRRTQNGRQSVSNSLPNTNFVAASLSITTTFLNHKFLHFYWTGEPKRNYTRWNHFVRGTKKKN